jgi:hypothetical protein
MKNVWTVVVEGVRTDEHNTMGEGLYKRRDLYLRKSILKSMQWLIFSQWRCMGTGEM